jgi:hypothetical protein
VFIPDGHRQRYFIHLHFERGNGLVRFRGPPAGISLLAANATSQETAGKANKSQKQNRSRTHKDQCLDTTLQFRRTMAESR